MGRIYLLPTPFGGRFRYSDIVTSRARLAPVALRVALAKADREVTRHKFVPAGGFTHNPPIQNIPTMKSFFSLERCSFMTSRIGKSTVAASMMTLNVAGMIIPSFASRHFPPFIELSYMYAIGWHIPRYRPSTAINQAIHNNVRTYAPRFTICVGKIRKKNMMTESRMLVDAVPYKMVVINISLSCSIDAQEAVDIRTGKSNPTSH